jgi:glutamate 5-kinase
MIYKRIVVKLGTSTLTAGTANLSYPHLIDLARQIAHLRESGCQVILVSSGAIAAGREALRFPELPKFIPAKQMLAAVGQPHIMAAYSNIFKMYSMVVAQVLLTRADLSNRNRYLNARNTLEALLAHEVVPVINENDTVAVEEIRFGDNDSLSALVANLVEADLLILLTDTKGLYNHDPRRDANAVLIDEVNGGEIPRELWEAAGGSSSGLGTGGMSTKLQAADLARRGGATVVIAYGKEPDILTRIASGERTGTLFKPTVSTMESRKRYILAGNRSVKGVVTIDEGAGRALCQGSSLLPIGVTSVEGAFEPGDTVRLMSVSGKEIAIGLVNYGSRDLKQIQRRHSDEIENLLGYTFGDEVVHRNNMILLQNCEGLDA